MSKVVWLALLGLACGSSVAAAPRPDPWAEQASAEASAKLVLSQCLQRAESTPPDHSEPCVRAVYLKCESEHGTMSQRDLNDCAYFSRYAWEDRLTKVRAWLLRAKTIDAKFGEAGPMVERLKESERRWEEWNKADCEMQAALSEGGTMHSMEIGICLSDHAAHRARELEGMSFWWSKVYDLPGSPLYE